MPGFFYFRSLNSQHHNLFGSVSAAFIIGSRGWLPLALEAAESTLRGRNSVAGNQSTASIRVDASDFDNAPGTLDGNSMTNSPPGDTQLGEADLGATMLEQDESAATACSIFGQAGADTDFAFASRMQVASPNDDMILIGGGGTGFSIGFCRVGGNFTDPAEFGGAYPTEGRAQIQWPLDGEFQFLLGVAPNEASYPGGTTWEFVLRINGADSIIASGDNTGRFFTNNVTVAAVEVADLVCFEVRSDGDPITVGADIIVAFRPTPP